MYEWQITVDAAGTLAQIFAVLLLAVAFDPAARGTFGAKIIEATDGQQYRVPLKQGGAYRFVVMLCTLLVIAIDTVVVIADRPFGGWFGVAIMLMHPLALGALISFVVKLIWQHLRHRGDNQA